MLLDRANDQKLEMNSSSFKVDISRELMGDLRKIPELKVILK